jgi:tetratricopeptide (TPR) repeat protein
MLGFPDTALRLACEALHLAEDLNDPYSVALALHYLTVLRQMRGEVAEGRASADRLLELSREHGFTFLLCVALMSRGLIATQCDETEHGLELIDQGWALHGQIGAEVGVTYWQTSRAHAYLKAGRYDDAGMLLKQALNAAGHLGECWWQPEIHRLIGELIRREPGQAALIDDDQATADPWQAAERAFDRSLRSARTMGARSLELRAAQSLAALCATRGHGNQARQLLEQVCSGMTEGGDTADQRAARAARDAVGRL